MNGSAAAGVTTVDAALHGRERALALYYRALCGRSCILVPYDDDSEERQHPDTDTTLRLPSHLHVPPPPPGVVAADWYRVAVTHRALHHELGTFSLDLDAEETFFRRLRPRPLQDGRAGLEELVGLFARPVLGVEVFVALEDLRIDAAALRILPGLRPAYDWVRGASLADRPDARALPPRSAVAEALVRRSLGAASMDLAVQLHDVVRRVAAVAAPLEQPDASVETSLEAALRVYGVLARLPNVGQPSGPVSEVALRVGHVELRESDEDELHTQELRLEGDEVFDVRFAPVRYRDVPGPRYLGQQASGMPMREAILRMTAEDVASGSAEEENSQRSQAAESGQVDVTDDARPAPPPEPLPHDHGPDLDGHHHATEGPVRPTARGEHAYPEWDEVAGTYLHDWCLVRELRPRSGRGDGIYRRALARHRHLVPALVSELERVRPAGRTRVLRMRDGDDLDLDACIEAMVDLRAGVAPSDRVHAAVSHDARDVAAAFALDLSSSTAERLPADPRRPQEVRRILDVEREAVVLLVEALERVGDAYGVYGFSGTGRKDVQVRVVKDVDERRSPAMPHRLDGMRPHHTTRMGPVVRHLTRRLLAHEAPTKILFVVSDGRPFDVDYGQQYGEEAVLGYALADTARALREAREHGVRPYLLTVDPAGEDYLRDRCDPRDYHVLGDARDLPTSLAQLYLAVRAESRSRTSLPVTLGSA